jgi:hypothetical protein
VQQHDNSPLTHAVFATPSTETLDGNLHSP